MQPPFIPVDGVRNLRDFGGQASAHGGRVRSGVLFRSASFAALSPAGRGQLRALGPRLVIDLRRRVEREEQPNLLDGMQIEVLESDLDEGGVGTLAPHLQFLLEAELTEAATHAWMVGAYRRFAWMPQHRELFAEAFRRLAAGQTPAVVHCAAGKDRTGLLCALVLSALGVEAGAIEEDYLLTNSQPGLHDRAGDYAVQIEARLGRAVSPQALQPMVGVHADFLRAAWDEMSAVDGGWQGYLAGIGVEAATLEALRNRLIA